MTKPVFFDDGLTPFVVYNLSWIHLPGRRVIRRLVRADRCNMRVRIQDFIWLIALIAVALAWTHQREEQVLTIRTLEQRLQTAQKLTLAAERRLEGSENEREELAQHCDSLVHEVRELRGVLKSSLADKRDWFRVEVAENRILAIRPATTDSAGVTSRTIEQIESQTGLKVSDRLKHFVTPIRQLQIKPR